MSETKSQLMAVCKTLLSIPGPVSDVRLMCPGFKYGQMALSLDARMRSVELEPSGEQLKISWKISPEQGSNMTSKNSATSQRSTILSVNDPRIQALKYRPGDRFFFTDENLKEYHPALAMYLREKPVILEVESILLDVDGQLVYKMYIPGVLSGEQIPWAVDETFMEGRFMPLGKDASNLRFLESE